MNSVGYALIAFAVAALIFAVSLANAEIKVSVIPEGSECFQIVKENPLEIKLGTVIKGLCVANDGT